MPFGDLLVRDPDHGLLVSGSGTVFNVLFTDRENLAVFKFSYFEDYTLDRNLNYQRSLRSLFLFQ